MLNCNKMLEKEFEIEDKPTVFSTSRFTFPYTLVGRPFPDLSSFPKDKIKDSDRLVINQDVFIRSEFFGVICFKYMLKEKSIYGNLTYLNKLGSLILSLNDGQHSVNDLLKWLNENVNNNIAMEDIKGFIAKLLSLQILEVNNSSIKKNRYVPDYKIWESKEKRLTAPLRLYLNVTKKCNLKCKHCYADAGRGTKDLERDVVDRVLKEASELKIPSIVLIGGEPFLYRDFLGVVKNANNMGLSTVITSNGMLIDEQRATELKNAGMKIISISVDGANEETHDFIRGKGSFTKTFKGIENCIKAGMDICISTTLTSKIIADASKLIDLAIEKGARDFQFMVFSPVGRGKKENNLVPNDVEIIKLKETLLECYKKYSDISINCTGAIIPETLETWHNNFKNDPIAKFIYTGCEAARFRCEVSFEGYISPCILLDNEPFRGGHIATDTIKNVWQNSPIFKQLGRYDTAEKGIKCRSCKGYENCYGGCRGVIYSNYNDINREYPTCTLRG